ncbi:putative ribonuclease H-like domain-containing protein [Tanacetum coccineum]
MSMDDLYNNLKVYEAEIKSQSSSSSNSQNVAFAEEGLTNFALMAYTSQGSSSLSSSDSEVHTCSKDCLKSYETLQKQYDQQREALNKSNLEIIDDSVYKAKVSKTITIASKTSKDSLEKPKTVRPSAPIIEDWSPLIKIVEKLVLNNKGRVTGQREIRPVWNNAQRVNHQNKFTHPHPKRNFVPTTVVTKSGQVPVNAAKQSSPRAATSISTARPVNTAAPKSKVNDALPKTYSYFKAHSPVKRAFNQKSAAKTNNLNEKVKTARVNNVTTAGPKAVVSAAVGNGENVVKVIHNILYRIKVFWTVGCSRHKNRKTVLFKINRVNGLEFCLHLQEVLKGGKITGKTGKLGLEIRLRSTECLVLSPDFKLLNESQVLLKVLRHNNMYSFDLKNVVPSRDSLSLTTFWAEAVSTACYVQNRVLVTKSHNKTPYELLHGRPPSISFMRPFGCPVTILNTLDPLGKFDGKADEGPKSSEDAVADDAGKKTNEKPANEGERNGQEKEGGASNKKDGQNMQDFRAALDNLLVQQKEGYANSTNRDNTVSPSVSAARQSFTNADDLPTNPLMPDLEDTANLLNIGIFSGAYDDEDVGAEADLNNLETTMNVSLIPTTIIHKDHPNDQIIGDINSATQTRGMTKISEEPAMVSYIKTQRRTNHKDYQNCLLAYFLSQIEPKKVTQALTDPRWIEAMQDELLQFSLQKVWRLVDLPKGKHVIGTKWVYRNKKDERVIVVRNKARLVTPWLHKKKENLILILRFLHLLQVEAIQVILLPHASSFHGG